MKKTAVSGCFLVLNLFQQFSGTDAVELGQSQQVGGGWVGGAVFPLADRLTADAQGLRHKFLGHAAVKPLLFQRVAKALADRLNLLLLLSSAVFFRSLVKKPTDQPHRIPRKIPTTKSAIKDMIMVMRIQTPPFYPEV